MELKQKIKNKINNLGMMNGEIDKLNAKTKNTTSI
jgi:hypothetical protein